MAPALVPTRRFSGARFRSEACRSLLGIILAAAVATTHSASADEDCRGAAAQSLFDEARRLLAAGSVDAACPKFAESQRLAPSPGTLLNLATCHERQGKIATAWEEFLQVRSDARRDRRGDREKIAVDHLTDLEPRLPWLTVKVHADASRAGIKVIVDGTELGSASWNVAIPVNPGDHGVSASAPRKQEHSVRFRIAEKERREIEIPVLTDAVVTPPSPAPPASVVRPPSPVAPPTNHARFPNSGVDSSQQKRDTGSGGQTAGYVAGAIGVLGMGVGTVFGLGAMAQWNDSKNECPNNACSPEGSQLSRDAAKSARMADVSFGVGILGLGLGTALILAHRPSAPGTPSIQASVSPRGAVSISGSVVW